MHKPSRAYRLQFIGIRCLFVLLLFLKLILITFTFICTYSKFSLSVISKIFFLNTATIIFMCIGISRLFTYFCIWNSHNVSTRVWLRIKNKKYHHRYLSCGCHKRRLKEQIIQDNNTAKSSTN